MKRACSNPQAGDNQGVGLELDRESGAFTIAKMEPTKSETPEVLIPPLGIQTLDAPNPNSNGALNRGSLAAVSACLLAALLIGAFCLTPGVGLHPYREFAAGLVAALLIGAILAPIAAILVQSCASSRIEKRVLFSGVLLGPASLAAALLAPEMLQLVRSDQLTTLAEEECKAITSTLVKCRRTDDWNGFRAGVHQKLVIWEEVAQRSIREYKIGAQTRVIWMTEFLAAFDRAHQAQIAFEEAGGQDWCSLTDRDDLHCRLDLVRSYLVATAWLREYIARTNDRLAEILHEINAPVQMQSRLKRKTMDPGDALMIRDLDIEYWLLSEEMLLHLDMQWGFWWCAGDSIAFLWPSAERAYRSILDRQMDKFAVQSTLTSK